MKKTILLSLLFYLSIFLFGCSNSPRTDEVNPDTITSSTEPSISVIQTPEPSISTETPTEDPLSLMQVYRLLESTYLDALKNQDTITDGSLGITDDKKTIVMSAIVDGMSVQCNNPTDDFSADWTGFIDGYNQIAILFKDTLSNYGYKDVNVSFVLLNDMNKEKMLYMSTNGIKEYDIME